MIINLSTWGWRLLWHPLQLYFLALAESQVSVWNLSGPAAYMQRRTNHQWSLKLSSVLTMTFDTFDIHLAVGTLNVNQSLFLTWKLVFRGGWSLHGDGPWMLPAVIFLRFLLRPFCSNYWNHSSGIHDVSSGLQHVTWGHLLLLIWHISCTFVRFMHQHTIAL